MLLRAWGSEPPLGKALFASALTNGPCAAALRATLVRALEATLTTDENSTRERHTAMAASLVLGLALLSQARVPGADLSAPSLMAELSAYLELLLWEHPA